MATVMAIISNHGSWQQVLATVTACIQPWFLTASIGNSHGMHPTMALDSMFWQESRHIPNRGSWQYVLATVMAYTQPWLLTVCFGNSHGIYPTVALVSMCLQQSRHMPNHGSWQHVLATDVVSLQLVLAAVRAYSMFWQQSRQGIYSTKAVDSMFWQQSRHIPNHGSWQYILARVTAYTQSWLLTACFGNSHDICLTMGLDSMFWQQSRHIPNHSSWQYVLARVTAYTQSRLHYVLATVMAYTQAWLLTASVCNSHDMCLTMGLDSMFWQQSRHLPNPDSWQYVLATVLAYTQP